MALVQLAFFGDYRPAYFHADTIPDAVTIARKALRGVTGEYGDFARTYLPQLARDIAARDDIARIERQNAARTISVDIDRYARGHCMDAFTEAMRRISADYPPLPGLDYSLAVGGV